MGKTRIISTIITTFVLLVVAFVLIWIIPGNLREAVNSLSTSMTEGSKTGFSLIDNLLQGASSSVITGVFYAIAIVFGLMSISTTFSAIKSIFSCLVPVRVINVIYALCFIALDVLYVLRLYNWRHVQ